jgi:hypothetical protein
MDPVTTSPATQIKAPTWTFLTVTKSRTIAHGALVPAFVSNVSVTVDEYLGDADGRPVQVIPDSMGSRSSNQVLDLSEVVTRADGTQLSVLALLDSLAMAKANPLA